MTSYAHVTDGAVDRTALPATGTLADGRTVSNYNLLPADVLKAEGWRPLVEDRPDYDPALGGLVLDRYDVADAQVTARYRFAPAPPRLAASLDGPPVVGTPFLVTYYDATATAPARVTFTANGATTTVALTDGRAELDVTPTAIGTLTIGVDTPNVAPLTLTAQE